MKVKALASFVSAIGTYNVGDIFDLKDKYTRENWVENGLVEVVKPDKKVADKK